MGDRANIAVLQWEIEDQPRQAVFLYSHWGGFELPETLRGALDSSVGRERWDDPAYLARIVFDTMVGGSQGGETGFGIATSPPDNEYQILMLDCENQLVIVVPEGRLDDLSNLDDLPSISFSDYCAMPRDWDNLTKMAATS